MCEESLKFREKERTGGNPPCVNKENLSCCFFSCYDWRLAGAPPPRPLFFLTSFSPCLFYFFAERKGGSEGVRGGDLSIGIVFIFIKTFLLSIELLQ